MSAPHVPASSAEPENCFTLCKSSRPERDPISGLNTWHTPLEAVEPRFSGRLEFFAVTCDVTVGRKANTSSSPSPLSPYLAFFLFVIIKKRDIIRRTVNYADLYYNDYAEGVFVVINALINSLGLSSNLQ